MIGELSPLLHRVATQLRPEDLQLSRGSWVYFSDKWTDIWKWASGNLFEVCEEPIVVNFMESKVLPVYDWKDIDLSNSLSGLKLYPTMEGILYETFLGFKEGDYITQFYVPSNKYVYQLGESSMFPDVDDASKRWLGAKKPSDSPAETPTIRLHFIKDSPPFYLRPYVIAGTFEQCTFVFSINKCKLKQIHAPAIADTVATKAFEEKKARARRISYHTEMVGF